MFFGDSHRGMVKKFRNPVNINTRFDQQVAGSFSKGMDIRVEYLAFSFKDNLSRNEFNTQSLVEGLTESKPVSTYRNSTIFRHSR